MQQEVFKNSVSCAAIVAGLWAFCAPAAAQDMETVTVTGYRASLATAIQMKKSETAAIDSIVAEDIGKFPDSNLAEAMQRIPGVTLSRGDGGEGRNISVRGLGPGFTRVRLNGMEGASQTGSSDIYGAGNSGRSFDFNVFPTEIFSSLTARKTPSPDIEEGSLGATVDLKAPKPFDFNDDFVVSATARQTFQEVGETFSPRGSILISKKFGHFGILGSLSYQHRKTLEVGYAAVDLLPTYSNGGLCSPIGWTGTQNPATNAVKGTDALNCSTNNPRTSTIAAYSTVMNATGVSGKPGGGVFLPRIPRYVNSQGTNDRAGATLTLQWQPDDHTDVSVDLLYSRYGQRRVDNYIAGLSFARNINNNGQPMVSVKDIVIEPSGSLVYGLFDGVDVRSENLDDRYSSTVKQVNTQFRHDFSEQFTIDGYAGYSENVYNAPWRFQTVIDAIDTDNFSVDFRSGGSGTSRAKATPTIKFGFDISDPANFNFAPTQADGTVLGFYNMQGKPSRNTSVNKKFEANATYKILPQLTLKAGGSYRVNNFSTWSSDLVPTQKTAAGSPSLPTGITLANITRHLTGSDKYWNGAPADWVQIDQRKLIDAINFHPLYCGVECGAGKGQIKETIKSFYIMGNFDLDLWGIGIRGDGGIRYAHTDQVAVGYIPVGLAATDPYRIATGYASRGARTEVDRSYDDWLPSVNVVAELTPDLLFRASYAEVMTRPELGNITPGASVTATTRNATVNNPLLDPIRADTFDLAAEWYFRAGSLLSVAYFHKDMKSYIQRVTSLDPYSALGLPEALLSGSASTPSDMFNVSRYSNTKGGPLDGVEVNAEVPLTFLPGFWSNFGVQANYTFVTSKINYVLQSANGVPTLTTTNDLLMLSPHSASGVIYWEDDLFSARVTGTYRSDFIRAIPASQDSDLQGNHSTFYLDASSSYNLNEYTKLIFDVTNITDEMSVLYVDSHRKDTLFALRDGRTFSLGVNFKF